VCAAMYSDSVVEQATAAAAVLVSLGILSSQAPCKFPLWHLFGDHLRDQAGRNRKQKTEMMGFCVYGADGGLIAVHSAYLQTAFEARGRRPLLMALDNRA
jgi:hypothetical protein